MVILCQTLVFYNYDSFYVGQTRTALAERVKEHITTVKICHVIKKAVAGKLKVWEGCYYINPSTIT